MRSLAVTFSVRSSLFSLSHGIYVFTGSSQFSLPSSASIASASDVNVFVIEPIGMTVSLVMGRFSATFLRPYPSMLTSSPFLMSATLIPAT